MLNLTEINARLLYALGEALSLHNDYAAQLNACDGGNRPQYATTLEWLDHLHAEALAHVAH
jgi:hypothetical protein